MNTYVLFLYVVGACLFLSVINQTHFLETLKCNAFLCVWFHQPEAVIPEIRPESVQSNVAEEELQKLRDELEQLKDAFQEKDALAAEQVDILLKC